jgi:hypothetical protein
MPVIKYEHNYKGAKVYKMLNVSKCKNDVSVGRLYLSNNLGNNLGNNLSNNLGNKTQQLRESERHYAICD